MQELVAGGGSGSSCPVQLSSRDCDNQLHIVQLSFVVKENHAIVAWFKEA